ncbi:MAG: 23S rRNA (pseudouridine(1915)-N(3))-methyltransferase RlmH [Gemmatimonadaceae bacterium]
MRLTLAVVGKPRNADLAAAIHEYETRAARYWPLDVHEVKEERAARDPRLVRQREGERLLQRAGNSHIVACDGAGKSFTSEKFARWLNNERDHARDMTFVIGGAYGLSDEILAKSRTKISLAPWTLSHELARLVLAEQLYRAGTIVRGEPYHK